ncbi:uncharacterized protein LOC121766929 [Salvia splendens]|uniref:uncharacterized protein LOC121766929 n=1 Tax=Salvia splendens TaxID=180675 RepID=UPI001C26F0A4|nr:uncharacterized protein LOC121766929 [Salvia splendens]
MEVAIEEVLVNTRHRWYMWQVMNKAADKLPKNMLGSEELKNELNGCVWSELIEPDAFEETWHAIMERYGLANNDWVSSMFVSRKFWVPAFFRDFLMSSLIKTTSLSESQNSFFKRYSKSRANLMLFYMNYNHALETQRRVFANREIEVYNVNDKDSNSWTITYSIVDDTYLCGCKKFERLVCQVIHEKLRGGRWLKSQFVKPIHGGFCDDQEIHLVVDKKKIAFKNLYALFIETTQSIEGNIDQINAFAAIIEEGKKQLLGEGVVLSSTEKRALIENFDGSQVPNFMEVHPPDVVSTKGSGGRKKSKKESAMKLTMKPVRKCGN